MAEHLARRSHDGRRRQVRRPRPRFAHLDRARAAGRSPPARSRGPSTPCPREPPRPSSRSDRPPPCRRPPCRRRPRRSDRRSQRRGSTAVPSASSRPAATQSRCGTSTSGRTGSIAACHVRRGVMAHGRRLHSSRCSGKFLGSNRERSMPPAGLLLEKLHPHLQPLEPAGEQGGRFRGRRDRQQAGARPDSPSCRCRAAKKKSGSLPRLARAIRPSFSPKRIARSGPASARPRKQGVARSRPANTRGSARRRGRRGRSAPPAGPTVVDPRLPVGVEDVVGGDAARPRA